MKAVFSPAGLNLNTIVQKKKRQSNARFMDGASKSSDIKYFDSVLVCPPPFEKGLSPRTTFAMSESGEISQLEPY